MIGKTARIFQGYLIAFSPFCFYLIMVQIVGEVHPFSKFPMYTSFPTSADYFYVADESDNPISTRKTADISIDELKDMIEIRAKKYGIERDNIEGMNKIAFECLNEIANRIHPSENLNQIKWVRHEISMMQDSVKERKTILAECKLN